MSSSLREQLRQSLRIKRDALHACEASKLSADICTRLHPLISQAKRIAGYLALGKEVDLQSLQSLPKFAHAGYFVPIVQPHFQMLFAPVNKHTRLVQNRFGILEPERAESQHTWELTQASTFDVVLVPLVGFDEQCNRMGMGGGYYDRCFEQRDTETSKPVLIGVAYDLQQVPTVYPEHWDVPLDMIVTPTRTLRR